MHEGTPLLDTVSPSKVEESRAKVREALERVKGSQDLEVLKAAVVEIRAAIQDVQDFADMAAEIREVVRRCRELQKAQPTGSNTPPPIEAAAPPLSPKPPIPKSSPIGEVHANEQVEETRKRSAQEATARTVLESEEVKRLLNGENTPWEKLGKSRKPTTREELSHMRNVYISLIGKLHTDRFTLLIDTSATDAQRELYAQIEKAAQLLSEAYQISISPQIKEADYLRRHQRSTSSSADKTSQPKDKPEESQLDAISKEFLQRIQEARKSEDLLGRLKRIIDQSSGDLPGWFSSFKTSFKTFQQEVRDDPFGVSKINFSMVPLQVAVELTLAIQSVINQENRKWMKWEAELFSQAQTASLSALKLHLQHLDRDQGTDKPSKLVERWRAISAKITEFSQDLTTADLAKVRESLAPLFVSPEGRDRVISLFNKEINRKRAAEAKQSLLVQLQNATSIDNAIDILKGYLQVEEFVEIGKQMQGLKHAWAGLAEAKVWAEAKILDEKVFFSEESNYWKQVKDSDIKKRLQELFNTWALAEQGRWLRDIGTEKFNLRRELSVKGSDAVKHNIQGASHQ